MDTPQFSIDDIKILQELQTGWQDVWNRICTELLGKEGIGRLYIACKICLQGRAKSQDDCMAFTAFVCQRFQEKVNEKRLFLNYDHQVAGEDVFNYLCNPKNIRFYRGDFLAKELGYKITVNKETKTKEYAMPETVYTEPPVIEKHDFDVIRYNNQDVIVGKEIDPFTLPLPEGFNLEKIVLKVHPETEKFDAIESQAGIQLYPRLDDSDNTMIRLMEYVCKKVYQADVTLHAEPDNIIREEYVLAIERLEKDIDRYNQELYDTKRQVHRKEHTAKYQENLRKKCDAELEIIIYPLDAEQLMKLLGLSRANVDQRRARYKANWKTLFFSSEYIQAMGVEQ